MKTHNQPDRIKDMDNTSLSHRSTAKAALRNLIKERGLSDFLRLTGEVVGEFLPGRRGRPTRSEAAFHIAHKAVAAVLPFVEEAEAKASEASDD
ncbi:MAG: hypothetical protein EBT03_11725 [Betaproteobacteria bacterium]|nr:hypothetical protein [Betaproteobacteria bacterium]